MKKLIVGLFIILILTSGCIRLLYESPPEPKEPCTKDDEWNYYDWKGCSSMTVHEMCAQAKEYDANGSIKELKNSRIKVFWMLHRSDCKRLR